MTVWAIFDQTGTIINIVDDLNGTSPPLQYAVGQTQLDMKTLPPGTWTGHQLLGGQWFPPQGTLAQTIIGLLTQLSSTQVSAVMAQVDASAPVKNVLPSSSVVVSTAAVVGVGG